MIIYFIFFIIFLLQTDRDKLSKLIEETLKSCRKKKMLSPGQVSLTNLPNQPTVVLPSAEFPQMQDVASALDNCATSKTSNDGQKNTSQKKAAKKKSNNSSKKNSGGGKSSAAKNSGS